MHNLLYLLNKDGDDKFNATWYKSISSTTTNLL